MSPANFLVCLTEIIRNHLMSVEDFPPMLKEKDYRVLFEKFDIYYKVTSGSTLDRKKYTNKRVMCIIDSYVSLFMVANALSGLRDVGKNGAWNRTNFMIYQNLVEVMRTSLILVELDDEKKQDLYRFLNLQEIGIPFLWGRSLR